MPLSKKRDRVRKQAERDKFRLEHKKNTGYVQPKEVIKQPSIDADGNAIPDYT